MNMKGHVYVALSGGVDSAVAALQLKEAGYQVTGIHMSVWQDPVWEEATHNQPDAASLAKSAADFLGIPLISLDVRDQFYKDVVQNFIHDYLAGKTPNPCMFCNPQVKWGILQSHAFENGADFFATGHYARIERLNTGKVRLLRGQDRMKDQSYVLSMLTQFQLNRSLLPLGAMTKNEVRLKAKSLHLPVADRQDSQDLCFLGNVDYRDFLERYAPKSAQSGEIVDLFGNVLGEHQGLPFYTIGQRKGIRIAASEPYYVISKDVEKNRLVVGFADQIGKKQLSAAQANWILGDTPDVNEIYDVMIRYRSKPIHAELLSANNEDFRLKFKHKVRGITPGQVAVLYCGEECLGGGVIQSSE
jgi:tRNA-specific 2-thiouridylase